MDEESEDRGEQIVRLPGGFQVRRRFTRSVLRSLPSHTPAEITMTIEVSNGEPIAQVVAITPRPFGDGFGDEQLAVLSNLVEARDAIVAIEAQETTRDRGYTSADTSTAMTEADLDAVLKRDHDDALRAVRSIRRRRQVTPDLLARVRQLYDEEGGGIQAVMEATNYSESYCFKLLRKARQEVSA